MAEDTETPPPDEIEPDGSPFELQAIEGLPFDAKSDEADAIRKVIEEAKKVRLSERISPSEQIRARAREDERRAEERRQHS